MNQTKRLVATDSTIYARSLGYTGNRQVLVLDGKVISHRNQDWFAFCESLRSRQKLN